jgi:hypothetical protein
LFQIDGTVQLSLERPPGNGIRITIYPVAGLPDAIDPDISLARPQPAPSFDDDLADATWEDAEWR